MGVSSSKNKQNLELPEICGNFKSTRLGSSNGIEKEIKIPIESAYYTTHNFGNIDYFNKNFNKYRCFCIKHNEIDDFTTIFELIKSIKGLNDGQKYIILTRFKRISNYVNRNYRYVQKYYNASKIFIITTGIVIPALMGVNGLSSSSLSSGNITTILTHTMFYFIWTLQLLLSIISSYVNYFKWDKKYFLYMAYKNKIEQEIWLYLELSSRYGIRTDKERKKNTKINHLTRLPLFLNRIEYLFKKLKESNYDIEITDEEKQEKTEHKVLNDKFSPGFFTTEPSSIPSQFHTPPKFTQTIPDDDEKIQVSIDKLLLYVYKIINLKNNYSKITSRWEDLDEEEKEKDRIILDKIKSSIEKNTNYYDNILPIIKSEKDNVLFKKLFTERWNTMKCSDEIKNKCEKHICESLEIEELPLIKDI